MKKLLILALLPMLFSCGGSKNNGPKVTTALKTDIDSLNPFEFKSAPTKAVMMNVYQGLVMPSTKGGVEPALAKSYEVSDDAKTYTFTIRDDVTFHNGDKLTPEDVVFSINKMKELKLDKVFAKISDVKVDGDKVVVSLSEPDTSLIYYLIRPIVDEKSYDTLATKENGTGPYSVASYQREQKLVFKSYDKYYGQKATIPEVDMDVVPNADTSFLNFVGGKYNFLTNIDPKRLSEIKDKFTVVSAPSNGMFILGINNKTYDLQTRAALAAALNKKEIVDKATDGLAKILGDEKIDADTSILKGKTFTLTTPTLSKVYTDIAQVIKEQLSKAGATVNIEPVDFKSVWLPQVYKGRNYELTLIFFGGKLDPGETFRRFVSDYKSNFLNVNLPEYDKLYAEATSTTDQAKSKDLFNQAYALLRKEHVAVFLLDFQDITAMDKKLSGYVPYSIPFIDFSKLKFGE